MVGPCTVERLRPGWTPALASAQQRGHPPRGLVSKHDGPCASRVLLPLLPRVRGSIYIKTCRPWRSLAQGSSVGTPRLTACFAGEGATRSERELRDAQALQLAERGSQGLAETWAFSPMSSTGLGDKMRHFRFHRKRLKQPCYGNSLCGKEIRSS